MQAAEALQRLIAVADLSQASARTLVADDSQELSSEFKEEFERIELAIAVSQAMLNSMIPVARYRAFVEIDPSQPEKSRTKKQQELAPFFEYTASSPQMAGIKSGLLGITWVATNVRVIIFEQRATGADVVSGFQGQSKSAEYRRWLQSLDALESHPTEQ